MPLQDIIYFTKQFIYVESAYWCIKLGYCAIASFFVFGLIFLLRRTVFKNSAFAKGMVWILLLPVLFMGKIKLYYTKPFWARMFLWWHDFCSEREWIRLLYFCGMFVTAAVLFYKRHQMKRLLCGTEQRVILGRNVYVTELFISPFSTGLFKPKIVLPKLLAEQCSEEEIRLILLHEQTHIRLGHLWLYSFWNVLGCILWVNPFFHFGRKMFCADMEQICDLVSIKYSGGNAQSYGGLILKSIGLLKEKQKLITGSAAFADEKEYGRIRSRMQNIAAFTPYSKRKVRKTVAVGIVAVTLLMFGIRQVSYAHCTPLEDVCVYSIQSTSAGNKVMYLIEDSDELRSAVAFDDNNVYIDCEKFDKLLAKNDVSEREFYILFGGFQKLPGIGGCADCVYVEYGGESEQMVIPYDSQGDSVWSLLFKYF